MPKILYLFLEGSFTEINGLFFLEICAYCPYDSFMTAYYKAAVFGKILVKESYDFVLQVVVKIY